MLLGCSNLLEILSFSLRELCLCFWVFLLWLCFYVRIGKFLFIVRLPSFFISLILSSLFLDEWENLSLHNQFSIYNIFTKPAANRATTLLRRIKHRSRNPPWATKEPYSKECAFSYVFAPSYATYGAVVLMILARISNAPLVNVNVKDHVM